MSRARETTRGLSPSPWPLLAAGLVLAWHATSGPHVFDAGEIVAAGALLGGSHPPGQPLHALLAHATTLLPLGPMAWRIALLSAASAAVAAWLVGRITADVLERLEARRTFVVRLAPDTAALATLVAAPVLRQATRVEVYGVALALTAGAVLALVRWGGRPTGGSRCLYAAALCAGLAISVHPPHALVPLVLGALLALTLRRDLWRRPRVLGAAALSCVVGLSLVAYLPVRAAAGAPMWGEPTDLGGLWDYVSGAAYRQNLGAAGGSAADQLWRGLSHAAVGAGMVPLAGVALLALRSRSSRAVPALLLSLPASLCAAWVIAIDPAIPDASAYAGPAAVLVIAAGCAGLAALASERGSALLPAGIVALVLTVAHPLTIADAPHALAQGAPALETMGGALLDTPPPRTVAMVENDFEAATWMMAQAVDGARPDAVLFVPGLATSSWHWRSLAHHPLFDGQPVRGTGDDARAAYVNGAFRTAAGEAPVAIGPTPIEGGGTLAGPYRILWPRNVRERPAVWEQSVGERLAPALGRRAASDPPGDRGVVAAVVRQHQNARARRLAARGLMHEALAELGRAIRPSTTAERRALEAPIGTLRRPVPPVVSSPDAVLVDADQAGRTAATVLWAAGEPERARALLEAQSDRGVAAAVLQLAWLRAFEGDVPGAREAMAVALAESPALGPQAAALERSLAGGGP